MTIRAVGRWVVQASCLAFFTLAGWAGGGDLYKVTLNGLDIGIDRLTESLEYVSYPAPRDILESP